jgi:hypothetical protein
MMQLPLVTDVLPVVRATRFKGENAMKRYLAVIAAVGLFLIPAGVVADPAAEIHAYGLVFEVSRSAPPLDSCPHAPGASNAGVTLVVRNVVFLGPGVGSAAVGSSGIDVGDVAIVVCNGDTPQRISEDLTEAIQHLAADRGYAIKPVNIVVPMLQRGN